jgi:hypothetical protein
VQGIGKRRFHTRRTDRQPRKYNKETEEGAITVVPVHSNKPLKKGTPHNIPTKTGITKEKLSFLLSVILKAP